MENRQSIAYGYCRVSPRHRIKQEDIDKSRPWINEFLSMPAQRERIIAYYTANLQSKGVAWGGFFEDPSVSAAVVSMENRKGGSRLLHTVEPDDHVLFAKLDRAFRKVSDAVITMDKWRKMGVSFHVLDVQLDTSTPIGRMVLHMVAAFAEMEREMISSRTKEIAEFRKANGMAAGKAPYGFRTVGHKKKRRLEPFPEMRHVGKHIVEWKIKGFSWDEIFQHLKELQIINPGSYTKNKEWTVSAIRRAFTGECRLMAEEESAIGQGKNSL